jgi:hypothetical protein
MVQDYDRPLEIDFLLIVGVFMIILGLLLFEASAGRVSLNGDSIYGLSLVLVAFEAIAMGKTPFGTSGDLGSSSWSRSASRRLACSLASYRAL